MREMEPYLDDRFNQFDYFQNNAIFVLNFQGDCSISTGALKLLEEWHRSFRTELRKIILKNSGLVIIINVKFCVQVSSNDILY